MSTFNHKRFSHLMAWTLRSERKNWTTMTLVVCAAFLLFLCYAAWDMLGESPAMRWDRIERGTLQCLGTCCGLLVMFAAQIIAHLKTKEQRLAYFSLPASTLEKYLSRLLYLGVLLPLTLPVAMIVADALATLFALSLGADYAMEGTRCAWLGIGNLLTELGDEQVALAGYAAVGYIALLLSLVTLSATVFRQGMAAAAVCFIATLFATGLCVERLSHMGSTVSLSDSQARLLCVLLGTLFLLVAL